jgi:D-psicose/D-tagatose/L-ribulose 3-epimerase
MSVTFGASTWLWTSPFTSEQGDLLRSIAKLGFEAVELPIEDPDLVDPAKIRPVLEETGLTPYLCGAFGPGRDLTNADSSVRANTRAYLSRLMDLAEALGVPFIAGPMYAQVGKARQLSPEDRQREWDLAASELRTVANEAGNRGLKLAIEAIIEEADIGDAIRHAGDDLIHVQVSENHRGVTGTGLTPWQDFRQALQDINYKGAVVIESFTPDNRDLAGAVCIWKRFTATQDEFASRGLEFLRDLFDQPVRKAESAVLTASR